MKVVVIGDFRKPIMLETDEATGLLIQSDDGNTNTIYRFTDNGRAWVRYTQGEDKNFSDVAQQLGLAHRTAVQKKNKTQSS